VPGLAASHRGVTRRRANVRFLLGHPRKRYCRPVVVLDLLAERTGRGMLCRAAGAWLLVGLPVIVARLWWTVPAALIVFVVALTVYVTLTVRLVRRPQPPGP
jgi:hypothetical protein